MTSEARPTVSVIVPTYNRADLLRESLKSILRQSFAEFEVVVVDDGSTDATSEVLTAINDRRVRTLWQPNRGISAAMNSGLQAARGRYIARLDSDDLWEPSLLTTLVSVLESRPEIGVVYGQADAIQDGKVIPHIQGLPLRFPEDSLRSLLYDDTTCNIAILARRECFARAGPYDESLIANEDWDIWLRIARFAQFAFVPERLARIRWHSGNLTGVGSGRLAEVLRARTVPLDKVFSAPDLPPEIAAMRASAYSNVHLFCGLRWRQAGEWRHAMLAFWRSVRCSDRPAIAVVRVLWRAVVQPVLGRSPIARSVADQATRIYRRVS